MYRSPGLAEGLRRRHIPEGVKIQAIDHQFLISSAKISMAGVLKYAVIACWLVQKPETSHNSGSHCECCKAKLRQPGAARDGSINAL